MEVQGAIIHRKIPPPKDCMVFSKMEPGDRVMLVESHKLCMGCLTAGHGRTANSCPFKEVKVDTCRRPACKANHHHLLHTKSCQPVHPLAQVCTHKRPVKVLSTKG